MAILYRTDRPKKPKGTLARCQWCGGLLHATDFVWPCQADTGLCFLACDRCHEEAKKRKSIEPI